jgi:hypothetical protein
MIKTRSLKHLIGCRAMYSNKLHQRYSLHHYYARQIWLILPFLSNPQPPRLKLELRCSLDFVGAGFRRWHRSLSETLDQLRFDTSYYAVRLHAIRIELGFELGTGLFDQ